MWFYTLRHTAVGGISSCLISSLYQLYLNWLLQMTFVMAFSSQSVTIHLSLTVSQEPEFFSVLTVNSSTEIRCFTTRPEPWAVNLHRGFHSNKNAVYLNYENKKVTHKVIATEFTGRIDIKEDKQIEEGHGLTFKLSLLKQEDTDWYYCSWLYYNVQKTEEVTLSSKGRIIIVKGEENQTFLFDSKHALSIL